MQSSCPMVIGSSQDMGLAELVQVARMSGLKERRKLLEVRIESWSK